MGLRRKKLRSVRGIWPVEPHIERFLERDLRDGLARLRPSPGGLGQITGQIECRERLGGLLRYYCLQAALAKAVDPSSPSQTSLSRRADNSADGKQVALESPSRPGK